MKCGIVGNPVGNGGTHHASGVHVTSADDGGLTLRRKQATVVVEFKVSRVGVACCVAEREANVVGAGCVEVVTKSTGVGRGGEMNSGKARVNP